MKKMPRRSGFATRFALAFVIGLGPLCLLAGYFEYQTARKSAELYESSLRQELRLAVADSVERLELARRTGAMLAGLQDIDAEVCDTVVGNFLKNSDRVLVAAVLDENGRYRCGKNAGSAELSTLSDGFSLPDPDLAYWLRQGERSGIAVGVTLPEKPGPTPHFDGLQLLADEDRVIVEGGEITGARQIEIAFLNGNVRAVGTISRGALEDMEEATLVSAFVIPLLTLLASAALSWFLVEKLVLRDIRLLSKDVRSLARVEKFAVSVPSLNTAREVDEIRQDLRAVAMKLSQDKQEIANALSQRNQLLKELYHRVGNNFQTILSTINLSKRHTKNEGAKMLLSRVQSRVHDMNIVHQMLAKNEGEDLLDAGYAISVLVDNFRSDHLADLPGLEVTQEIETIRIAPKKVFPIAYVLSENLNNCARGLAAHQVENPKVEVHFGPGAEGEAVLRIANGPYAAPLDLEGGGAGKQLIAAFVRELRGDMSLSNHEGQVVFEVRFPVDPA